jgi:hypothetical protein
VRFIMLVMLLFVLPTVVLAEPVPPAAHGGAADPTVLYVQIIIAVIGSLGLPLIFFLMNRGKATTDKLHEQAEVNRIELRTIEIRQINQDLADLKAGYRKAFDKLEELQRSYDRHPLDCQKMFITSDVYRRENAAQKEYVKLLYATIKRHLDELKADMDSSDDNI